MNSSGHYKMEYKITVLALGKHPAIDIDESTFEKIKQARICLNSIIAIEEKYQILFNNFIELEKECLNLTTDYMLDKNSDYSGFFDIKLAFNRRLINLLTSTKLYIDQIQPHVRSCLPNKEMLAEEVKALFSMEYDNNFEYRFMEALRNYVQHRSLAVHSTSHGGKWTTLDKSKGLEFTSSFYTLRAEVENDSAFKKSVLSEMPEKVDLIYATRVYIESINRIHCAIRDMTCNQVNDSRALIESLTNDYVKTHNTKAVGLYAVASNDNQPIKKSDERISLFLEWDDLRVGLQKKYGLLVNLHKRYVSNIIYI